MAITLKSAADIEGLRAAGHIVAETFEVLREHVRPGVSTARLDQIAEEFIRGRGADPIYKGYLPAGMRGKPFPATICASVNDVICHGIPSPRQVLREGDIIGVDIGVLYRGWVGDACVTYAVGQVAPETQRLLDVARQCLDLGIAQARAGSTLGDVGAAIQRHAERSGFSVVREYTGHGVGRHLHEEPTVLHYGRAGTGLRLRPGLVFTIEPMINAGRPDTRLGGDGWTVRTADGSLSAQYEHALAITESGPVILTV